jgi:hypothetical protein
MYRLSKQPIEVELTEDEVQKSLDFVENMRRDKVHHNVTDRMFDRKNTSEGINIIGHLGEAAVAKVLGLTPDTSVLTGGDDGNDLTLGSTTIQVKTSVLPSLIFNAPELFKSDVAILAQYTGVDKTRSQEDPKFVVWGWIEREVFLVLHHKKDYGYGTRLVMGASMLHSLDSLVEEALGIERWDLYVGS